MRKLFLVICLAVSVTNIFSQVSSTLENIREAYQSFDYEKVINLSATIFDSETKFTNEEKIEVFTMKGVSHYTLNQQDEARISFIELLKLNNNYELDPVFISPKIITFFNSIKNDYIQIVNHNVEPDTSQVQVQDQTPEISSKIMYYQNNAHVRSLLLPGLGHIYSGETTKGWLLLVGSTGLLGSMIYSIIETNNREKEYLTETNVNLLPEKYNRYNDIYKVRNYLISAYAAVWLYTQIDLLFFDDKLPDELLSINNTSGNYLPLNYSISLSIKL